jgi:hypothetical protein
MTPNPMSTLSMGASLQRDDRLGGDAIDGSMVRDCSMVAVLMMFPPVIRSPPRRYGTADDLVRGRRPLSI